jgi:ATP-dependent RNA helicase DHX57
MRDITSLRQEFLSTLISLNLVPDGTTPSSLDVNTHSSHTGLVKAIILAGLWPRVSRVHLPKGAIKFDRVQAGTVQRANEAKEYKFYDIRVGEDGGRVFLHPASVLFHSAEWRSPFVTYFQKQQTTKLFLRDATEVRRFKRMSRLVLMCMCSRSPSMLCYCLEDLSLSTMLEAV